VADLPVVRPGQVWADNDPRSEGRRIEVVRLGTHRHRYWSSGEMGYVEEVVPVALCRRVGAKKGGRLTRIRIDRFRPTTTGYRLVADTAEEVAPA